MFLCAGFYLNTNRDLCCEAATRPLPPHAVRSDGPYLIKGGYGKDRGGGDFEGGDFEFVAIRLRSRLDYGHD